MDVFLRELKWENVGSTVAQLAVFNGPKHNSWTLNHLGQ